MADVLDLFNYAPTIQEAAQKNGLRPQLLSSLMNVESGGRQSAVSPKGAIGLMQVMPGTAAQPGFGVKPFDPNDPVQNIHGGASYLKALLDHYGGDEQKALAAYNAGPGAIDAGRMPAETQAYVPKVEAGAQGADILDLFNGVAPKGAATSDAPPSFLDNLAHSAGDFAGNIGHAIMHPLDTAASLGKTALGVGEKLIPGDQGHEQYADALGKMLVDRYGGWDKIKHTAYTDPVGFAADLATVLPGLGEVADVAGLGKVGDVARMAGKIVDPMQLPGKAAEVVASGLNKVPEHFMNAALKVPSSLRHDNPKVNFARTALDHGISGTDAGMEKTGGLVNKIESAKTALRDANADASTDFPIRGYQDLLEHKQQISNGAAPVGDLAEIDSLLEQLTNHPKYSQAVYGTQQVPVTRQVATEAVDVRGNPITQSQTALEPQRVQVGRAPSTSNVADTQAALDVEAEKTKGTFGRQYTERPAETVGRQILRSAESNSIKDAIDPIVVAQRNARSLPQRMIDTVRGTTPRTMTELNAEQGPLIALRKALEQGEARRNNLNPLSLTMQLMMGMGGLAGGGLEGGAGAAILGHLLSKPGGLSAVARTGNAITSPLLTAVRGARPFLTPAGQAGRYGRQP